MTLSVDRMNVCACGCGVALTPTQARTASYACTGRLSNINARLTPESYERRRRAVVGRRRARRQEKIHTRVRALVARHAQHGLIAVRMVVTILLEAEASGYQRGYKAAMRRQSEAA